MAFAILRNDGWSEIAGGFVAADVHYPDGWLEAASADERAAIGVAAIAEPDAPADDVRVVGERLVDQDGAPARVYDVEPIDAAELRAARRDAITARAEAAFHAGFAPAHSAFAGERLQVRGPEDRTNWLTSQASYAAAVQAGFGDVVDATFRTMDNRTVTISYAEGLDVLLAMAAWGRAIMTRGWALKDAIDAGDPADIDAGWPA